MSSEEESINPLKTLADAAQGLTIRVNCGHNGTYDDKDYDKLKTFIATSDFRD